MRSLLMALAVGLGLLASPAQASTVEEVQKQAELLLPWVAEQTGYPARYVKPSILLLEQEEMNARYYGPLLGDPKVAIRNVGAATFGRTILLPTWFMLGLHDHLLVHELVHVLQNEYDDEFLCPQAREQDAYRVENVFIDLTGVGEKQHPVLIALYSHCPRPSLFK